MNSRHEYHTVRGGRCSPRAVHNQSILVGGLGPGVMSFQVHVRGPTGEAEMGVSLLDLEVTSHLGPTMYLPKVEYSVLSFLYDSSSGPA